MKTHYYYYYYYYYYLIIFFTLLLLIISINPLREAFEWKQETIKKFQEYQTSVNPTVFFDLKQLQEQASEEEVQVLLSTGKWAWDSSLQEMYKDNIQHNPIIKTNPQSSMEQAQTLYNPTIMKKMLYWKTPEGSFTLLGRKLDKSKIECKNGNLVQTTFKGFDGITQDKIYETRPIDFKSMPDLFSNFHFKDKPCNPCEQCEFSFPFV
jgi:hypothetical protein